MHGNNTSGALDRKLGWVGNGEGGRSRSRSWLSTNLISLSISSLTHSLICLVFFFPQNLPLANHNQKWEVIAFLFNGWSQIFSHNQFLRNLPYFLYSFPHYFFPCIPLYGYYGFVDFEWDQLQKKREYQENMIQCSNAFVLLSKKLFEKKWWLFFFFFFLITK
jgi:hypothetical protein